MSDDRGFQNCLLRAYKRSTLRLKHLISLVWLEEVSHDLILGMISHVYRVGRRSLLFRLSLHTGSHRTCCVHTHKLCEQRCSQQYQRRWTVNMRRCQLTLQHCVPTAQCTGCTQDIKHWCQLPVYPPVVCTGQ